MGEPYLAKESVSMCVSLTAACWPSFSWWPTRDISPCISQSHHPTNVTTPQTMWVNGFFNKIPLTILIDSGSTHKFIDPQITKQTCCFFHPCFIFKVMIANGGTLPCKGKCRNVHIFIGYYNLCSNMFSMPLGVCDVILGTQCLRTLDGAILWDFVELWMQFFIQWEKTHIEGITTRVSQHHHFTLHGKYP